MNDRFVVAYDVGEAIAQCEPVLYWAMFQDSEDNDFYTFEPVTWCRGEGWIHIDWGNTVNYLGVFPNEAEANAYMEEDRKERAAMEETKKQQRTQTDDDTKGADAAVAP